MADNLALASGTSGHRDHGACAPVQPASQSAIAAKVIVVMPARNAARTLERTVSAIPTDVVDEIILVDDRLDR